MEERPKTPEQKVMEFFLLLVGLMLAIGLGIWADMEWIRWVAGS